jgi:2-C-methyl-D-erythritol 4-phosphate cytidylyltransferase/2-C-methyl-D-erythritol 2,4-cyclodiphosphate synthase
MRVPGEPSAVAVVLAAGSGSRLGEPVPKAFVSVSGRPIIAYALESIANCSTVGSAVLVVPESRIDETRQVAGEFGLGPIVHAVVTGGPSRQESVRIGLEAVPPDVERIVCHDAARPLASPDLFDRVVEALNRGDGAVPVVGCVDTVKRIREGRVIETIPRHEVGLVQTPQAFGASALREAHQRASAGGLEATDDAMLLEAAGFRIVAVEGEPWNFKVTTIEDVRRAERVLDDRARVPRGPNS